MTDEKITDLHPDFNALVRANMPDDITALRLQLIELCEEHGVTMITVTRPPGWIDVSVHATEDCFGPLNDAAIGMLTKSIDRLDEGDVAVDFTFDEGDYDGAS